MDLILSNTNDININYLIYVCFFKKKIASLLLKLIIPLLNNITVIFLYIYMIYYIHSEKFMKQNLVDFNDGNSSASHQFTTIKSFHHRYMCSLVVFSLFFFHSLNALCHEI